MGICTIVHGQDTTRAVVLAAQYADIVWIQYLYFFDLQNVLRMFDIEGKFLRDFPLAVGTVTGYSGRKKDSEVRKC